jgi:pimeloyl-ACP methyl ester carboxylesterase
MRGPICNRRILGVLLATAALAAATGCMTNPHPTVRQEERGLVYVFPGIGCGAWCMGEAYKGLREAGVDQAVWINEWDTPFYNALGHLADHESNRAQARVAAEKIAAFHRRQPEAPIDLLGYSGGGGLAVMVAEALPADVRVRHLVLAQAAVSPDYDLSRVLRNVRGKVVNLYCPGDWFILGVGTTTFGTVDREHTASAGKDGFNAAAAVPDPAQRHRLVQDSWSRETFARSGHAGGHIGILGRGWNREFVGPWLRLDATDEHPRHAGASHPWQVGATADSVTRFFKAE